MISSWSTSEDLTPLRAVLASAVVLLWFLWLLVESRRREQRRWLVLATGFLACVLALLAVLRPVRVVSRGTRVGARVVVVVDAARRMLLPASHGTRFEEAVEAARALGKRFQGSRISYLALSGDALVPFNPGEPAPPGLLSADETDLRRALETLAHAPGERPAQIVFVSDGRLSRPTPEVDDEALSRMTEPLSAPLHTVEVDAVAPADASIREVRAAGSAVAHQPLALRLVIGCSGGLTCDKIPVSIRELRRGEAPVELAQGTAELKDGEATVELSVTLERAGARVIEVKITAPEGDRVPENDTRILTFNVARDRVRLLHVAGRPTYDVRALRMWLKSDESVDLVAFFILRTNDDQTNTDDDSELALIPFPVDELFTQHLPSFDAVILQDIDAVAYKLAEHLPNLEAYVRGGGGLIMVGGPSSFAGGHYARTALEKALPVELGGVREPYDAAEFEPSYTAAGRAAAVLRGLRELTGDELPRMPGANWLGKRREGAFTLWDHPDKSGPEGRMPVLVLGDYVDGRTIALGVDGTHLLAFSELAERSVGRAYGALWDGLLGWLMRDPRYEAVRLSLPKACIAGQDTKLSLVVLPGTEGDVNATLIPLGVENPQKVEQRVKRTGSDEVEIDLGKLDAGGYSVQATSGAAPPTRLDFACEKGGAAWADSRPNPELLERVARAGGGKFLSAADVGSLPLPSSIEIAAERRSTPFAPSWAWTLGAALMLGIHWITRRQSGML